MLPTQSLTSRRRIATAKKDGDWQHPGTLKLRLTSRQQRIAERYLPMARKYAGAAKSQCGNDYDTALSVACLGLVRAAAHYDGDEPKFVSKLWWSMRRSVHDYRLRQGTRERVIHRVDHEKGTTANLVTAAVDGRERSTTHAVEMWDRVWARLSGVERNVIDMRFRHGADLREVARVLGVTHQRVAQIEQGALARCREILRA